jgi:hypothetical protein
MKGVRKTGVKSEEKAQKIRNIDQSPSSVVYAEIKASALFRQKRHDSILLVSDNLFF